MRRIRVPDRRGFTLLEVIAALTVVVLVVALIAPTLAELIQSGKEATTQQDAERIYRAIYGKPAEGDLGYVADMGRLPANLAELIDRGTQTAFHTDDGGTPHKGNVGTGWRGPYLRGLFSTADLFKDAWGQGFSYTATGGTAGQIISGGPDGDLTTTGNNIPFPFHAPLTTGNLFVSVVANQIPDALGAAAKVYSPVNGEQTGSATQKRLAGDATFDGFFFENLTHGLHVVSVAHTGRDALTVCVTVKRMVPVTVHAGQQVIKEVRLSTTAVVSVTINTCTIADPD